MTTNACISLILAFCFFHNIESMTVMTYNIHSGADENNTFDLAKIASVITASDAWLVALEEVDNLTQRHFVNEAQVLGHLTKTHAHFLAARDFQGGTFGITILTKQKAHGERRFYYHNTSAECGDPVKNDMCQVALALLVQFDPKDPKSLFWFVCTHLVTNNMGPTLLEAQQLIEEFVPKLLREHNVSIVIGGDFNSDPNSDVIQFMSQHAKDLWSECGDPNSNGWTFSSLNPRSRIDYLFLLGNNKPINNPCKVAKVLPVTASDHMPLVVSW